VDLTACWFAAVAIFDHHAPGEPDDGGAAGAARQGDLQAHCRREHAVFGRELDRTARFRCRAWCAILWLVPAILYVEDAAEAIILATEQYDKPDPVNLGSGMEISIRDLATKIASLTGFSGRITWDTTSLNGQPRRCLDVSQAERESGFRATTPFDVGLRKTTEWYQSCRVGLARVLHL